MRTINTMLMQGPKVAIALPEGFIVKGCQNILPNTPGVFLEFDSENPTSSIWLFELLPDGAEIKEAAAYIGSVGIVTQNKSMIAVPGSKGMAQQDQTNISICHIYCRPCPAEELPPDQQPIIQGS